MALISWTGFFEALVISPLISDRGQSQRQYQRGQYQRGQYHRGQY